MIKKYLFTILAILFLTSSCSLFGINTGEQTLPPAGIAAETLEGEQYTNCVDACSSCESNCKDNAYYTKATTDENENLCANIASTSLQSECKQAIIAQEAVSQLNKEKCMELTDEASQQTCQVHVAAEIAIQSNDVKKCLEATDVERCQNTFYKDMAVSSGDLSYCEQMSDPEQQTTCQELVASLSSTTVAETTVTQ